MFDCDIGVDMTRVKTQVTCTQYPMAVWQATANTDYVRYRTEQVTYTVLFCRGIVQNGEIFVGKIDSLSLSQQFCMYLWKCDNIMIVESWPNWSYHLMVYSLLENTTVYSGILAWKMMKINMKGEKKRVLWTVRFLFLYYVMSPGPPTADEVMSY